MIAELTHKSYGSVKTVVQPITFSGERNQPGLPPPMLGEHTAQILRDFGYSPEEISQLEHDKAVRAAHQDDDSGPRR